MSYRFSSCRPPSLPASETQRDIPLRRPEVASFRSIGLRLRTREPGGGPTESQSSLRCGRTTSAQRCRQRLQTGVCRGLQWEERNDLCLSGDHIPFSV
jgi:hypothetical protein